jgi:hypothetical protein
VLWPAVECAFYFKSVSTTAEVDCCSDIDINGEHTSSASKRAILAYISMSAAIPCSDRASAVPRDANGVSSFGS